MAQVKFRANLSAANIPFVSDFQSRTIIVPQIDQNVPRVSGFGGSLLDNDVGIPQAFFAQNIMPNAQGLQSVGFTQMIDPISPAETDFDRCFVLRDSVEDRFLLSPAGGKCYIYGGTTNTWVEYAPAALAGFDGMVTISYLHGQTYVFFENVDCFVFDSVAETFTSAGFTGVTVANMLGIVNAINYNVLFDEDTIYWSNPLLGNETDFVPNPLTGAGSIQIQEIRGNIVACLPITGGFVVYSTQNAVKALYSGNAQFPWVFSEIPGSAGVQTPEQVTFAANLPAHYAYTTSGLMEVRKAIATQEFPEASDFLSGKLIEEYSSVTKTLTTTYLDAVLKVHLTVCGNRYLVISYGVEQDAHTYAIIYDIVLKRWGKVKVSHVDCIDFVNPSVFGATTYQDLLDAATTYAALSTAGTTYEDLGISTGVFQEPGKSIGFLQNDGAVQVVNFELDQMEDTGAVLYIGKFQLLRKNTLTMQEVEVENVEQGAPFELDVLTSYTGKSFDASATLTAILDDGLFRDYGARVSGLNHTLRFRGNFNLVYLGVTCVLGGNR